MQFMNAIITTPEEIDVRVHLRNEFVIAGFNVVLPRLRDIRSDEMTFQLNVYEEEASDDWQELLQRFHGIQMDMHDEQEVFAFLLAITQDTPAAPYFKSILQHLLLIRDDEVVRYNF
jgi:uncharacterized protein (UPF0305 family)